MQESERPLHRSLLALNGRGMTTRKAGFRPIFLTLPYGPGRGVASTRCPSLSSSAAPVFPGSDAALPGEEAGLIARIHEQGRLPARRANAPMNDVRRDAPPVIAVKPEPFVAARRFVHGESGFDQV